MVVLGGFCFCCDRCDVCFACECGCVVWYCAYVVFVCWLFAVLLGVDVCADLMVNSVVLRYVMPFRFNSWFWFMNLFNCSIVVDDLLCCDCLVLVSVRLCFDCFGGCLLLVSWMFILLLSIADCLWYGFTFDGFG